MHGCSECTERDHIWSGMGIVPCLGPCVLRDSLVFRSRAPDAALSFVGPPTVGTRTQETGACRSTPPTPHTTPITTSRPGSNNLGPLMHATVPHCYNTNDTRPIKMSTPTISHMGPDTPLDALNALLPEHHHATGTLRLHFTACVTSTTFLDGLNAH